MRENTDQNNSEYRNFSRSERYKQILFENRLNNDLKEKYKPYLKELIKNKKI